jgi:LacI family transcriptional regulator
MTRPTIMDVARKCGVSKTTVSVILNDSPASSRVPKETQDRVRKIAESLGYRPNWRARALASRRTHMIGVLYAPPMPLIVRGNYEGIMAGINEVLSAQRYHMLYVPLGERTEEWSQILLDQRMDGCLVLSRVREPLHEILKQGKLFASLVNADTNLPYPHVLADDYGGATMAVEHLISLGHKRIAFLMGRQPPHYSVTQRQGGYEDVMRKQAKVEGYPKVYFDEGDELVRDIQTMPKSTRPTAVLVYTHFMAIRLLQKLWEAGLRVPKDLSVSTFGNAFPVEDVIPPLTTVSLQTEEMGRGAAKLLLEQIDSGGAAEPKRVVMSESLVVRKSTAAPPAEE